MVAIDTKTHWKHRVINFYDKSLNYTFRDGLWANCPIEAIMADPQLGTIFYDDFHHQSSTKAAQQGAWVIIEDDGAACTDGITDAAN